MTSSPTVAVVHETGFSKRLAMSVEAYCSARGFKCSMVCLAPFNEGENAAPIKDEFMKCDAACFLLDSECDDVHPQLKWLLDPSSRDILLTNSQPISVLGVGLPVNKFAQRVYSLLVCGGSPSTKKHATYITKETGQDAFQQWMLDTWDLFQSVGIYATFPLKYQAEPRDEPSPSAKPTGFKKATVVSLELITAVDYPRPSYLLTLDYSGSNITGYKPGDHVSIMPENKAENVERMLKALKVTGQETVEILDLDGNKVDAFPSLAVSSADIFKYYLDIQGKASRRFLASLSLLATDQKEAQELTNMAIDFKESSPYAAAAKGIFSHVDVLEKFPSIEMTIAQVVSLIPQQTHRNYSVSSSPLSAPNQVQVTFTVLSFPTASGVFTGLNTGYMATLKKGDTVSMRIKSRDVSVDLENECVGVALGSGVSMLRGIVQHFAINRSSLNRPAGKMLLYYGVRHQKQDYMFGNELESYRDLGVLDLHTAFSHDQEEFITPVHRMKEDPAILCQYLVDNPKCIFYYCGPAGPAYQSIEQGIKKAIESQRPNIDPSALISQMTKEGRWQAEAFTPGVDAENPFK